MTSVLKLAKALKELSAAERKTAFQFANELAGDVKRRAYKRKPKKAAAKKAAKRARAVAEASEPRPALKKKARAEASASETSS